MRKRRLLILAAYLFSSSLFFWANHLLGGSLISFAVSGAAAFTKENSSAAGWFVFYTAFVSLFVIAHLLEHNSECGQSEFTGESRKVS